MMTRRLTLALLAALFVPAWAAADNNIYRRIAPSTVWFFERGSATGVLVDVDNRLVLTAEHVVRGLVQAGKTNVMVIFAQVDGAGNVLTEKSYYGFERKRKLPIQGRIIRSNRMKDLALVQLERVPPGIKAVPLAEALPQPGESLHVIGNSTYEHGGLFSYSAGRVRNSYFYERFLRGDSFFALAHHTPTNRGDSGGPVLNDRGELVAIISQGTTGSGEEQVIDHSVHLRELRHFLAPANLPLAHKFSFTGTTNVPIEGDFFCLPVQSKQSVSVSLKGNGATDLDLWAFDFDRFQVGKDGKAARNQRGEPMSKILVSQTGKSDQETDSFTPNHTCVVELEVRNIGTPNTLTARNVYTLEVNNQTSISGPINVSRAICANSTDTLRIPFQPGAGKVRISLRGDGDTDLNLFVTDPDGKTFISESGPTDREKAEFTVTSAGVFSIQIKNMSDRQYNRYTLSID